MDPRIWWDKPSPGEYLNNDDNINEKYVQFCRNIFPVFQSSVNRRINNDNINF